MKTMIMLQIFLWAFSASAADLTLALNWKPEPQFGGFYAAEVNGHFKNEGLKVKILEGGSGTPTVQMLASGKVDFAIVSAEEILISNERNTKNPVVAVFAVYQTNPQMIMCHEARAFQSLKDVFTNDGVLAWQSGLSYALFLQKKYPSPKVRRVPYAGGISNFLADEKYCQQGFATSEPLLAAKAGRTAKVFLIADEGFNPYTTVLAVRKKDLNEKKEMITKMVKAVRLGWNDYVKEPGAVNSHMAKLNAAMDADTFLKSAQAQAPLIANGGDIGRMILERWQSLADQLRDIGVLKRKPNVSAQFTNL